MRTSLKVYVCVITCFKNIFYRFNKRGIYSLLLKRTLKRYGFIELKKKKCPPFLLALPLHNIYKNTTPKETHAFHYDRY